MKGTFLRVNDTLLATAKVRRIVLPDDATGVSVLVDGKAEPFVFESSDRKEAVAFYLDLCQVLQQQSGDVPFLIFAGAGVRLDTVGGANVLGQDVLISLTDGSTEAVRFASDEAALDAFDQLAAGLGIAPQPKAPAEPEPEQTEKAEKPKAKGKKKKSK